MINVERGMRNASAEWRNFSAQDRMANNGISQIEISLRMLKGETIKSNSLKRPINNDDENSEKKTSTGLHRLSYVAALN